MLIFGMYVGQTKCRVQVLSYHIALVFELLSFGMFIYKIMYAR